jgi:site-specific DNA-methyltransferase (adenine-specific)
MQTSLFENIQLNEAHQPPLQQCNVSRCTMLHGDCLELMKGLEDNSVNMIFADLPYGTTNCHWDVVIPLDKLWNQWNRIAKKNAAIVLTGQQPFTTDIINSNRKNFRYEIIWQKTQAVGFLDANRKPMRAHENILVFYRKLPTYNPQKTMAETSSLRVIKPNSKRGGQHYSDFKNMPTHGSDDKLRFPTSVLKISNWNGALFGRDFKKVKHPTQKPVELLDWIIKTYTNEGDTVLDCVMGSGTTAVSCKQNGRHFIGIEKERTFYNIAISRVSECCG